MLAQLYLSTMFTKRFFVPLGIDEQSNLSVDIKRQIHDVCDFHSGQNSGSQARCQNVNKHATC